MYTGKYIAQLPADLQEKVAVTTLEALYDEGLNWEQAHITLDNVMAGKVVDLYGMGFDALDNLFYEIEAEGERKQAVEDELEDLLGWMNIRR